MTKHRQYFQDMLENNKELFDSFKVLHDKYREDTKHWQKEYNDEGEKVLSIIRRYENLLCSHSESTRFGKYSANLSEKFWQEIRNYLPKIDAIGLK